MSYDILYRACFVRDGDNIIPLVEIGPSNCYEPGTRGRDGKRVRDWHWLTRPDRRPILTLGDLRSEIDALRSLESKYKDQYLMYKGAWISNEDFARKLEYWAAHAAPLGAFLKESSASFRIGIACYNGTWDDVDKHFINALENDSLESLPRRVDSLISEHEGSREHWMITSDVSLWSIPAKRRIRLHDDTNKYFVVTVTTLNHPAKWYVYTASRNGFRSTSYRPSAKRYASKRTAEACATRLQTMFPKSEQFTVEEVSPCM